MAAKKGTKGPDRLELTPSQTSRALKVMAKTKRSAFVWGPPGIAKSAIALQVANDLGMQFSDVRLSQMDPSDLRGIPYPVVENGVHGIRWAAPMALPRDLYYNQVAEMDTEELMIRFENPFKAEAQITVKAITKGLTAELVEHGSDERSDFIIVKLVDENGELAAGKLRWTAYGKVKVMLALEEFNSAPNTVQVTAYQLIHDRKVGEYVVPEGVMIVAMGNNDTDKGVTYKMATPVANRFVHIDMQCHFDDWQVWALRNGIHFHVIGYLTHFKGELFDFDPGTASKGFATPRSWHMLSDILHVADEDDVGEMELLQLLTGCVGQGVAFKFLEYQKVAKDLPKPELILSGALKQAKHDRTEVALSYALVTSICHELKIRADKIKQQGNPKDQRANWLKEADNALAFMMTNFSEEICIMANKTAISVYKLPFDTVHMKNFDSFASKFKDLIMG